MDFIKGIIKKMDELPPIFYESEIKEPEPKNIDEIRKTAIFCKKYGNLPCATFPCQLPIRRQGNLILKAKINILWSESFLSVFV